MRASMSVPGVYSPVEYDGMWLVDGGLVQNLPVPVALAAGINGYANQVDALRAKR